MGYLRTFNDREFIPCAPTDEIRGGILAETATSTTNMVEVQVGSNGKAYVDIDARATEIATEVVNGLGFAEEGEY